ncbi:hypothetical protein ACMFMF_010884 [Clarireedia jacksonii]
MVCSPGYYCPPGGLEKLLCPAGTYCPLGSFEPIKCDPISSCRAGSSRQFPVLGIILLTIIDILLVSVLLGSYIRQFNQRFRRRRVISSGEDSGNGTESAMIDKHEELEMGKNNINHPPHNESMEKFITSLKRCLGTNSLGFEIGFENLGLRLKNGKPILQNISGKVEPGSLLAVMGASGAGKCPSHLCASIDGQTQEYLGTIYMNGDARSMSEYNVGLSYISTKVANFYSFKKIIGYVPQDDVILPELTVRENILHSARVRLPPSWTENEIQEHINNLLMCLGLTHIQDNLVGDVIKPMISGGQRKRVSIGIELAAAPLALVLDEPTSGLDATTDLTVCYFKVFSDILFIQSFSNKILGLAAAAPGVKTFSEESRDPMLAND